MNVPRIALFLATLLSLSACLLIDRIEFTPLEEAPPPDVPSAPTLRFPPNNAYRGTITTNALRPLFQWEASAWSGPEVVRYELQLSTDRTFATGLVEVQTTGINHLPSQSLAVSTTPPVGARYFWRVRACVDQDCSAYSPTWWVNVGRAERDVNGDGYADVVLVGGGRGAFAGSAPATAGRLYVMLGGPGAVMDFQPDTLLVGAGDLWYRSAVALGDFDGDGFADVAAKVTKQNFTSPQIVLYLGNAGTVLDGTPDQVFDAVACAALGDVNGDGFDDLFLADARRSIVLGTAGTPASAPLPAGQAAKAAGDLNGDGLADLLIKTDDGVDVYFGDREAAARAEPAGRLRGASNFGAAFSAAGDVNGDGFADVLIGAVADTTGGEFAGRAYAYLGALGSTFDTTPDGVFTGAPQDGLGVTLSALGDLNGDGFDDFGIRLLDYSTDSALFARGRLRIYFGASGSTVSTTARTELIGRNTGAAMAQRMGAGDINGDGFDDLMLGSAGYGGAGNTVVGLGLGEVYFGGPGAGINTVADGAEDGTNAREYFGDIAGDATEDLFTF